MKRKLLSLLLALLLVFNLFGCQSPQEEDQTDSDDQAQEETPAPDPAVVYGDAVAVLDGKASVTLDVSEALSISAGGHFIADNATTYVLTYTALDTDSPVILMEEEIDYSNFAVEETEDEEVLRLYSEIFAEGTLYVELEDVAAFSGSITAEEASVRYIPVVLLDASLYENLTLTTSGDQTTILFESPTAAESWAIPETAEMLDASGSAVIGADGTLIQMSYAVTYKYGSSEITMEVESYPRTAAETVTVPEDAQRYTAISSVDALWLTLFSGNMLYNAETFSLYSTEQTLSQAGGVVLAQSTDINMYTEDGKLMSKVDTTQNLLTSSSGQTTTEQEETYIDGKYTYIIDDGLPTTQAGVTDDIMLEYCRSTILLGTTTAEYWQDVTIEDLGSTYFLEFTYTEDFANMMQNAVCIMFWEDPSMLNNIASAYTTNEISGYIAIDKYTRMITAYGLYYEGVHTIEGGEYIVSLQVDQSVEIAAFGAYEAITEEPMPEEEPEDKATPLLYHVTGEDGQEMWLFGTIHVGDARTGFLPQEFYDAFNASDALALEYNSEAFEAQLEEDEALMNKYSAALFYSDGTTLEDVMEEEDYALAVKLIKASGNYNYNMLYAKPYIWENSIQNFYLRQGNQLHAEQGMEPRLTRMANEQGKPIYEVESGIFQVQMTTGWSQDLQLLLLDEIMYCDPVEYWTETSELYELWCDGDEEAMREELNDDVDTSEFTDEELAEYNAALPLYEEYDKSMSYDRNEDMHDVAVSYLESGEVVFFAVGLAHLLDETNGLVYTLREAGYTVELVTYN